MTTINLLPWREKARIRAKRLFIACSIGAFLVAGLINLLWASVLQQQIKAQNQRNAFLTSEVQLAEQSSAAKKAFEKEQTTTLSQATTLKELNNQRFRVIELLQTLPNILPNNVLIDSIHVKADVIELIGSAKTDTQVSDLVKRLMQQANWSHVQLQEMSAATNAPQDTTFRITLSLE